MERPVPLSIGRGGIPPSTESDDEPDELQQGELPTGPTHVATRGTPRTKDQLTSARQFIAAAGRVKFDRGRATLKAVWMTVAYYASPRRWPRAGVLCPG